MSEGGERLTKTKTEALSRRTFNALLRWRTRFCDAFEFGAFAVVDGNVLLLARLTG